MEWLEFKFPWTNSKGLRVSGLVCLAICGLVEKLGSVSALITDVSNATVRCSKAGEERTGSEPIGLAAALILVGTGRTIARCLIESSALVETEVSSSSEVAKPKTAPVTD